MLNRCSARLYHILAGFQADLSGGGRLDDILTLLQADLCCRNDILALLHADLCCWNHILALSQAALCARLTFLSCCDMPFFAAGFGKPSEKLSRVRLQCRIFVVRRFPKAAFLPVSYTHLTLPTIYSV